MTIEVKLTAYDKELIEKAAKAANMTVSAFVLVAALEAAKCINGRKP